VIDQNALNDSGIVQVVVTHAVTLPWKMGLVQMQCWSVGVQVSVPKAVLRHNCCSLSVLRGVDRDENELRDSQHTVAV
jgi:hypothetical protein